MIKQSAGILLYRSITDKPQFFLVHPGGPFWRNKDMGAWTIPKGEFTEHEEPLAAAIREFKEETGTDVSGEFIEMAPVKQKGGKIIYPWALNKSIDAALIQSNTFEMEWPPKSGKMQSFPEIDKAQWFYLDEARQKINPAQVAILDELMEKISTK